MVGNWVCKMGCDLSSGVIKIKWRLGWVSSKKQVVLVLGSGLGFAIRGVHLNGLTCEK